MWNAFTRLAQANVDHYNNHPVRHIAIICAYSGGLMYVVHNKVLSKLYEKPHPGVPTKAE